MCCCNRAAVRAALVSLLPRRLWRARAVGGAFAIAFTVPAVVPSLHPERAAAAGSCHVRSGELDEASAAMGRL